MSLTDYSTHSLNRLDPLMALRAFLCLGVVIFNCGIYRTSLMYEQWDFTWILLGDGYVFAYMFFGLSGYLMGKLFYSQRYLCNISGLKQFLINRFLRIIPLYYFSLLILVIFVYPHLLKVEHWGNLLRLLTCTYPLPIPIFAEDIIPFNRILWALTNEVQFYLLVPFLYLFLRPIVRTKKQIILTGIVIFLLGTFFRFCGLTLGFPVNTSLIFTLDLFLCGFLVNPWLNSQKRTHPKKNAPTLKLLSIILLISFYLLTAYHSYHYELWNQSPRPLDLLGNTIFRTRISLYIWPILSVLILSLFITIFSPKEEDFAMKNHPLSLETCLENPARILEIFATLSYGIYLWHFPIIRKMNSILSDPSPLPLYYQKLLLTLILSLTLATLTYYVVERPAHQLKYTDDFYYIEELLPKIPDDD